MLLEVSNNSGSIARSCWQKYKFYAVDRLIPKRKDRALTLGETIHSMFDQMYQNVPQNDILQNALNSYDTVIKAADQKDQEDYILDKFTVLGMFEFYPKSLSNFQEIIPEREFSVPLARGIRLVGRVDGDVKENNLRWIRELKTTGLSIKQFEGRAKNSYQVSGYKFALEYLTKEEYQGVMFDVIRKPKLYKRINENAKDFGKRIFDDYALTKKDQGKRDSYYKRIYSYRNPFQMECFKSDMTLLSKEIRRRRRTGEFYRNPDACWLFNRECDYSSICWQRNLSQDAIDQMFTVKGKTPPLKEEVIINVTEEFE